MLEVSYGSIGGLRSSKNDQSVTNRLSVDGDCLHLEDIKFTNSVNINFRDSWIHYPNENFRKIEFVGCEFLGHVTIFSDNCEIQFENCSIKQLLESKSAFERISLDATSIDRFLISCENRHFPEIELINNSAVTDYLKISPNSIGTFKILKSKVNQVSLDWSGVRDVVIQDSLFSDSIHLNCQNTETARISRNKGNALIIEGLRVGQCYRNSFDNVEFNGGFPKGLGDNRFKELLLNGGDLTSNYDSLDLSFIAKSRSSVQIENINADSINVTADRIKNLAIRNCTARNNIKIEVERADLIHSDSCKSQLHTIKGLDIKTVQFSNYEGRGDDVTYLATKNNKVTLLKHLVSKHLELEQTSESIALEDATLVSLFIHDSAIDNLRGSNIRQPEEKKFFRFSKSRFDEMELTDIMSDELSFDECSIADLLLKCAVNSLRFISGSVSKGELEVSANKVLFSRQIRLADVTACGSMIEIRVESSDLDNLFMSSALLKTNVDDLKGLFIIGLSDLQQLILSEVTISGLLACEDLKENSHIVLEKKSEIEEFRLLDSEFTHCNIQNVKFEKIDFSNTVSKTGGARKIELINSEVAESVAISNSKGNESIEVTGCQIRAMRLKNTSSKSLQIGETAIGTLELQKHIGAFRFIDEPNEKLASGLALDKFSVINSTIPSFKMAKITAGEVHLTNLHPSQFIIRESSFETFGLRDFVMRESKPGLIAKGQMSFINKRKEGSEGNLTFDNCDLSQMTFNSCFFESFREMNVQSSKLDEIKCSSTTWPVKVTSAFANNPSDNFEVREACRQLKMAMANHHDRINELKFHALEMNAYEKIVRGTSLRKNWNDKFSLLGGLTNEFGLNWWRPVWMGLVVVLTHYILLIGSHYSIDCWQELEFYFKTVDFLTLFNPTHRIDHLSLQGAIGPVAAIFDTSSRIFASFFIYQTVVAFRKFRK